MFAADSAYFFDPKLRSFHMFGEADKDMEFQSLMIIRLLRDSPPRSL